MASTIALPDGYNLTVPDVPTFAPVAALPSGEGTDLNDEGETVLGTVGPSTPFQLAQASPSFAPPLMVSAPPTPSPSPSAGEGIWGWALLALIAGVVAYGAYMLWEHRADIEADLP